VSSGALPAVGPALTYEDKPPVWYLGAWIQCQTHIGGSCLTEDSTTQCVMFPDLFRKVVVADFEGQILGHGHGVLHVRLLVQEIEDLGAGEAAIESNTEACLWKPTDDENRKLVKHLRNERDALFTFLRNPAVPASNWWGEQAIRPAVVTRKIWGGNRTAHGAITQERVATFFRTSHQQDADPYTLLEVALRSPVPAVAGLPSLIAGP